MTLAERPSSVTSTPSSPGVDAARPRRKVAPRAVRASGWLSLLFLLAYSGVAMLVPTLPMNLAIVDAVILLLIVIGIVNMRRRGSVATAMWRRALPWVFLIVLGSFVPLIGVGLPMWAVSTMPRLFGAIIAFFACLHLLLDSPRLVRYATVGVGVGWCLTVVTAGFVQGSGIRATGMFANPNYTGHFIVLATLILWWQVPRRSIRIVLLLLGGYVVLRSGSFGSLAQLLAILGVLGARRVGRTGVLLGVLAAGVVALVLLLVQTTSEPPEEDPYAEDSEIDFGVGFNERRFERSRGSRLRVWSDNLSVLAYHPLGVGPAGTTNREVFDDPTRRPSNWAHADFINFAVQRGPLGLAGLLGLGIVIWKFTIPYGLARAAFAGILAAGLFRDTVHFRHMWLFLALAIAIDYQNRRRQRGPPAADEGDAGDQGWIAPPRGPGRGASRPTVERDRPAALANGGATASGRYAGDGAARGGQRHPPPNGA